MPFEAVLVHMVQSLFGRQSGGLRAILMLGIVCTVVGVGFPEGAHASAVHLPCCAPSSITLSVDQTQVTVGTTVTLTSHTDAPVDLVGWYVDLVPLQQPPTIGTCNSGTVCTGTYSRTTPGSVTFQAYVDNADGVVQLESNQVSVTWQSGSSSCGQQLGQHCTAIWTDKPQYTVGDHLQYCYSVPQPAHVKITDIDATGNQQVVLDGNDDGTGGCQSGTITPPTGTERLIIDVSDTAGGTPLGHAEADFQVVGSSCAPHCQASLSSDKSTYTVGDPVKVCYNPYVPSHVRISFTPPVARRAFSLTGRTTAQAVASMEALLNSRLGVGLCTWTSIKVQC